MVSIKVSKEIFSYSSKFITRLRAAISHLHSIRIGTGHNSITFILPYQHLSISQ